MLEAILHTLTSDETLSGALTASSGDTRIYPHTLPYPGPAIAYSDSPVSRGGVNLDKLEVRIAAPDYELCKSIADRVSALLNMEEQEPGWYYDGVYVLSCVLNGGGSLEFDGADVFERFLYFDVKWRTS